ncbi:MAG: flagellar protein FlgN [Spirochaetaceae bacterium]|jgi:hypothetical protein|nr:flagellar protein FlgN [Spirochaetaceae bacterium]
MQDGYREFRVVLEGELALVERIREAQEQVRAAVRRRDWADFEALLDRMRGLGADFEALDREREAVCARLAGEGRPEGDFYALLSRLEGEDRAVLAALYRELKFRVRKVRLGNDSLAHYLTEAQALVKGCLDAAFPEHRGKVYTRQGLARPVDMRSLVLNRQL